MRNAGPKSFERRRPLLQDQNQEQLIQLQLIMSNQICKGLLKAIISYCFNNFIEFLKVCILWAWSRTNTMVNSRVQSSFRVIVRWYSTGVCKSSSSVIITETSKSWLCSSRSTFDSFQSMTPKLFETCDTPYISNFQV